MLLLLTLACGEPADTGPDADSGGATDTDTAGGDSGGGDSADTDDTGGVEPVRTLRLGIPSYANAGTAEWTGFVEGAAATDGFVIVNPDSGPGSTIDEAWLTSVEEARALGVTVLGYVPTGYGTREADAIDGDVNQYTTWYGVDGIFFDEVGEDCEGLAGWYAERAAAADALVSSGDALVVMNPGLVTCAAYLDAADVLVVAEDRLALISDFEPAAWMASYGPERFMFLAYDAAGADLGQTLKFVHDASIGWTYITDDRPRNPWDELPTYWEAEVSAVVEFVE